MRAARFCLVSIAWVSSFTCACNKTSVPPPAAIPADISLAIVGATVYASPGAEPLPDAVVLVDRKGTIVAVARRGEVPIAPGVATLDAKGKYLVAGLWNVHVHLNPPLVVADADPAAGLKEMALARGFTTVVDLGSDPRSTIPLRDQVAKRQVDGPTIFTAGSPIYATDGIPFYLRDVFAEMKYTPDTVATAGEATAAARARLDGGADVIKLFTGAPVGRGKTVIMAPAAVAAAVDEAHRRGKPVFAHPQSLDGMRVAVENGVDVLAHTAPAAGPLPADFIALLKKHKTAVVPTLTLWYDGLLQEGTSADDAKAWQVRGVEQLRGLVAGGVEILFGTDVGYLRKTDTTDELRLMGEAGMLFPSVLAALTTHPARHFGKDARVAVGLPADLVVLSDDPRADLTAFARPAATLVGGKVVYSAARP